MQGTLGEKCVIIALIIIVSKYKNPDQKTQTSKKLFLLIKYKNRVLYSRPKPVKVAAPLTLRFAAQTKTERISPDSN